jgi:hypothetical protein
LKQNTKLLTQGKASETKYKVWKTIYKQKKDTDCLRGRASHPHRRAIMLAKTLDQWLDSGPDMIE